MKMSKKAQEKVRTIYDYIDIINKIQELRKKNPNNFTFGTKARIYLDALEEGKEYVEPTKEQVKL